MAMDSTEMLRLFEAHREAEAARDIDAILETFVTDCFLETSGLRAAVLHRIPGSRSGGRSDGCWRRGDRSLGHPAWDEPWRLAWHRSRRRHVRGPVRECRAFQPGADGRREDLLRPRHAMRTSSAPARGGASGSGRTSRRDPSSLIPTPGCGLRGRRPPGY